VKLRINYRVHDERLALMKAASEVMGLSVRQFAIEAPVMMARQIAENIVKQQQEAAAEVVTETLADGVEDGVGAVSENTVPADEPPGQSEVVRGEENSSDAADV
jgi:uncharacterized protein (DUF1778 family)